MKIVFVEFVGKGGMVHYAFQLCRALAASGADVTLLTDQTYELDALPHNFRVEKVVNLWDARPAGRLSMSPLAIAGRRLRRVGRALRYYGQWLRAIRRVKALKPDFVLLGDVRFPTDYFPLLLLRRVAPFFADICHNVHPFASGGGKGGGAFDRSSRQRFFYRRIYRLFDAVYVHFERNLREFTASFGVPESKVAVIVHGNEAIFDELRTPGFDVTALRKRLGLRIDEPVVLFFGTLTRYKGLDVLIPAFAKIQKETGARLVLAGFPAPDFDLAAHQEMARRSGVEPSVLWVPEYVDSGELAVWMELAQVIVFPYRDIYQSGALHVAQTFGVPTIASAIGAMQDVIENEVSGLLVPPEDVDALADAMRRLLADRTFARGLGSRFAEDARGRFAWSTIARIITDRYKAVRGIR
jgi:glycosyltransferase involved in cell wall biosynthesis